MAEAILAANGLSSLDIRVSAWKLVIMLPSAESDVAMYQGLLVYWIFFFRSKYNLIFIKLLFGLKLNTKE